jgi:hypothetical protein
MIKVTTQHGTYYLIDMENKRAKRVRGESPNKMLSDGEWFQFFLVEAFDRDTLEHEGDIEVGKSMYFWLRGLRDYDWRISTDVVSIEQVDHDVLTECFTELEKKQPEYIFVRVDEPPSWYEYNTYTYIYDQHIEYEETALKIISDRYPLVDATKIRNLLLARESDRIEV